MCGIAGFIGNGEIPRERLESCLRLMHHRGPDHQEHRRWTTADSRNVYLLHSRLNIIDLDHRADQPFHVNGKWMAFNGELYNYLELKAELAQRGHLFTTASDTEVLLRTIDEFGAAGLDRCEGMWAFAVFDEADGSLTLCRDRFGEKPLFLLRTADGLYFGSEIKFIRELLGQPLEVNYDQLRRFWVNGYKALYKKPETFFKGITELPSGSVLKVSRDGSGTPAPYWNFDCRPKETLSFEDAVSRVRELLIESVKLRLRSDVPLAFCMSGGVDSNALISIAKRVFDYDVHGFTIVSDDDRYNETDLVDQAVRELDIKHTAIPTQTEYFLPQLRALVRQHDAPVFTITYYAHWLLERSIAEHGYKISISGTAADELFSGYYDHHLFYLHAVKDDRTLYEEAVRNWEKHVKPVVRNPFLRDPEAFVREPDQRQHIYLGADEFRKFLVRDWHEPFAEAEYTGELMRNRMLNGLFNEATPVILHEEDLNAMYFSIENRSPFLDRRLFEFTLQIPSRHLIRDGRAKAVLREALRGIAPGFIVDNRVKVGFNAPIHSFLDVADCEVREYLLDDSPIFEHLRRDRMEEQIDKADLPNSEGKFLFNFLSSKMFLEEFAR